MFENVLTPEEPALLQFPGTCYEHAEQDKHDNE